jgi:hypothetical protein
MAGMEISPMAATVAGPDPEIAPKKQQLMTVTTARPPRTWPTNESIKWISLPEMPARSMAWPANMKKGMASRVNFDVVV